MNPLVAVIRFAAASLLFAACMVAGCADTAVSFTKANAPASPAARELPLRSSVSQYGITWTFDKAYPVGQFITGDWYVVGPVRIVGITPKPAAGRNGSCLNVDVTNGKVGFDDRIVFGRYDAKQYRAPPIAMEPGDSLLSSISLGEGVKLKPMLWQKYRDNLPTAPDGEPTPKSTETWK